jgi:DNA replication protein
MSKFRGFTESESFVPIPDSFFRHLLSEIDDRDELKVTLFALWQIGSMEGRVHFLRKRDFNACIPEPGPALQKAVKRGSLIEASPRGTSQGVQDEVSELYFLNSARGRAAAESYGRGQWHPDTIASSSPTPERPNTFKLYEENIGPLTPLIADALKDAESTYKPEWVAEALEIAVKNNKRNWKYVEAILRRWKEDGHAKKQDSETTIESSERYSKSQFGEYLKRD